MNNGTRNTTLRNRYRRTIARDKPDCHICKGEYGSIDYTAGHLHPMSFTIDHIQPLNKGGEDVLENLAAAHRMCNRNKSDTVADAGGPAYVTTRAW